MRGKEYLSSSSEVISFDELAEEAMLDQDRIDDELMSNEAREIAELVEQGGHINAAARKFGDTHLLLGTWIEEGSELSGISEAFFVEENRLRGEVQ